MSFVIGFMAGDRRYIRFFLCMGMVGNPLKPIY